MPSFAPLVSKQPSALSPAYCHKHAALRRGFIFFHFQLDDAR